MLTVLCGGVGAARLLSGLVDVVDPASVTAVVNVADDVVVHGLYVSPDLDSITYTLAGIHNDQTGWGVASESWRVMEELETLGGPTWFRLGDRDLATHLYRTGRLASGASLTAVAEELAASRGVKVRVVPVSNDPIRTVLVTVGGEELAFQEYFVARRCDVDVAAIRFEGADVASPAPGVIDVITQASRVVIAPSNPLVSIDPILAVPGVRDVVARRRDDVIAISPIVAGAAIKGPAARLLENLGHEASALGVAHHYTDLVGTFVIDLQDESMRPAIESLGMRCVVTDTVMRDRERAAHLAGVVADG